MMTIRLLALLALLPLAAWAATARPGYNEAGIAVGAEDQAELEGSDFVCPIDMSVVLPSINYTSPELPCAMDAATAHDGHAVCKNLTGKVALIAGGSTGIGRGTADRLVKAGMRVVGTSRWPERYTQDCAPTNTYENPGDMCKPVGFDLWQLDVTNQTSVDALIQKVKEKYSQIDFLFLNAGRGVGQEIFPPGLANHSEFFACGLLEQLQTVMDTNLWGLVRVLEGAIPLLAPDAYILATSSVNSLVSIPGSFGYTASKRGINALAEEWMNEHYPNMTQMMSTLFPGNVKTDVGRKSILNNCTDSSVFMDKIKDWENYYYSSPDVAFMTATEAGELVYRLLIDPTPPLRVLMNPEESIEYVYMNMQAHDCPHGAVGAHRVGCFSIGLTRETAPALERL